MILLIYERAQRVAYTLVQFFLVACYFVARHYSRLNTRLEAFGLEGTLKKSANVASVGSPVRGRP